MARMRFLSDEEELALAQNKAESANAIITEDGDIVAETEASEIISNPEADKFSEPQDLLDNKPPVDLLTESSAEVGQMENMVPIDIDMSTDAVYVIADDEFDDPENIPDDKFIARAPGITQAIVDPALDEDNKYNAHKAAEVDTDIQEPAVAAAPAQNFEPIRFSSASVNILKREKLTAPAAASPEVSLSLFKKDLKAYEYEVGQVPEGMDSYGPEWAFECEVRQISLLNAAERDSRIGGIGRVRGTEFSERLKAAVEDRIRLMNKLSIQHPRINITKALQAIDNNELTSASELYIKPKDVNKKGRRLI